MEQYKLFFSPIKNRRQSPLLKNSKSFNQERFCIENESKMQNDFKKFIGNKELFKGRGTISQDQLFESFLLFRKFVNSLMQSKEIIDQHYTDTHLSNPSLKIIEENPTSESQQDKTSNKNVKNKINNNRNNIHNAKLRKNYVNYDDIPIKQNNSTFVDLVEKNLEEMKNSPELYRELSLDRNIKSKFNNNRNKSSKITSHNKLTQSMNIQYKKSITNNRNKQNDSQTSNNSNLIRVSTVREKEKSSLSSNHYEAEEETIRQEEFLSNIITIDEPLYSNVNSHQKKCKGKSPKFGSNNKLINLMTPLKAKVRHDSPYDSDDIINNNSNLIDDISFIEDKKQHDVNSKQNKQLLLSQQGRQRSTSKSKEDADNVSQLLQEIKASTNAINASLNSPIVSYSHKKKVEENKFKKELSKEIQSIKEEKAKIEQIKCDYEQKNNVLLKEIDEYKKKEKEKQQPPVVNSIKTEEVNQLKCLQKKDKELISELRNQIQTIQEERRLKEMTLKITIEKLELQLKKANSKITELLSNQRYLNNKIRNKAMSSHKSCTNILSSSVTKPLPITKFKNGSPLRKHLSSTMPFLNDNSNNDTFDLVFPAKYILEGNAIIINEERTKDDKLIKTYSNNAKEIIYSSGSKKIGFEDGYQIYYFINNDIKQIYPSGKCVYYYSQAKATQTTLPDKTNVYKLKNGQIEKHYPNGNKEIIYPGGKAKTITSNGLVDFSNPLLVQKKEGNTLITSDSMQS